MRTILFRGKDARTGEWIEGDLIQSKSSYRIIIGKLEVSNLNGAEYVEHEVKPATVGQFTGLTDKNGMRIYEGDIVDWTFFYFDGRSEVDKVLRCKVEWHQGGLILQVIKNDFENAGFYALSELETDSESEAEVVGDIYNS